MWVRENERPWPSLIAVIMSVALFCGACSDEGTGPAGPEFGLDVLAGDGQTRFSGWELPWELTVQLVDSDGSSATVEGIGVEWVVRTGGGTISPVNAVTNSAGRSSARWILGPELGEQTVAAAVGEGTDVLFTARAVDAPGPIVFGARPPWDSDGNQLFTVRPDGTELMQLETSEQPIFDPRWSPDGTRIIASRRDVGLVVLDERGRTLETLVEGFGGSWSPDGSRFVFAARRDDSECEGGRDSGNLYLVEVDTGVETALTAGCHAANLFPDWSLDGEWIVFHSQRDDGQGAYIIRPDGSDEQQVLAGPLEFPRWDPSQSDVFAVTMRGESFVGELPDSNWIVTSDLSGEVRDTLVAFGNSDIPIVGAWSPDGSSFLFTRRSANNLNWILTLLDPASDETFPLAGGGVVSGGINGTLEFSSGADWK